MSKISVPSDFLFVEAENGVLIPLGVRQSEGLSQEQLDELSIIVNKEYMDTGKQRWTGDCIFEDDDE